MKKLLFILLIIAVTTPASRVLAKEVLNLNIEEKLRVYAKSTKRSKVLKVLEPGERVEIEPEKVGAWRKVYLVLDGERVPGYLLDKSIQASYVEKIKSYSGSTQKQYKDRQGFGLSLLQSTFTQPAFDESINEVEYSFSKFESQASSFQVHFDYILSHRWSFRLGAIYRKTNYKGEAQKIGINIPSVVAIRDQSLLGVLGQYKFYLAPKSPFYLGLGGEVSKGLGVEISYDGAAIETDNENLPFFVIFHFGVGLEWIIASQFFLNLEARVGSELNSQPTQQLIEGLIGVSIQL